jgi:hypothetical protein
MVDAVSYLPIDGEVPHVGISLAHRRNDRSPAVQNFVAVARRVMQTAAQSKNKDDVKEIENAKVPRH